MNRPRFSLHDIAAALKKRREPLKTALIVVLFCGAVFLGGQTGLFSNFVRAIPLLDLVFTGEESTAEPETGAIAEAARPLCILATDEDGLHLGTKYNDELRDTIYDRATVLIGALLGSGQEPEPVGETVWRRALASPGVYFEYASAAELSVLSAWFGVRTAWAAGSLPVARLCAVTGGDAPYALYFEDAALGVYYRVQSELTGLQVSPLAPEGVEPARFAYEIPEMRGQSAPYVVIFENRAYPRLQAGSPLDVYETKAAVLAALGVNIQLSGGYAESETATVYDEDAYMVRITGKNQLEYRLKIEGPETEQTVGPAEAVEIARKKVSALYRSVPGTARLYFDEVIQLSENEYEVRFQYYIGGGLVRLDGWGSAAAVRVRGRAITRLDMILRSYAPTEGQVSLLPEKQASAASEDGVMLCYVDSAAEILTPQWIER